MSITVVLVMLFSVILYQKLSNGVCKSKRRLDGKTCLVTGGTTGMGFETAMDLARRNARVIIACPFNQEGFEAERKIKKKTGNDNIVFQFLDLSSLKSTREFAQHILITEKRLDILINNAGVGAIHKLTTDGLNVTMQINFYGHFLLTLLLLPLLKESGTKEQKSRIVNIGSVLHNNGVYVYGEMNKIGLWNNFQLYGNSKFCILLFTFELNRKLKGNNVVVNCVNPGAVGTRNIFIHTLGNLRGLLVTTLYFIFFKTPSQGAQDIINAAVDENINEISGELFANCKLSKAKDAAYDENAANLLWEESKCLLKLDNDLNFEELAYF